MNLELLRGSDGRLLPSARFNHDRTRLCMPTGSGIACYRGIADEHGEWHGTYEGIAEDEKAAERFLEGAIVVLRD